MGRPIITTDTVGCRDTVEDGVNGFKVAARNPQALAKAMLFFADHPQNIASMGAASRAIAERNFDATKINAYILSEMGIV